MTSTPSQRKKGKTPEGLGIPTDWRLRYIEPPTEEFLNSLTLPFLTILEPKDTVPAEFCQNVKHLITGTEGAPITGYYTLYHGQGGTAKVLVSNVYGVWFEARQRGDKFECFRLARDVLDLKNLPLPGLSYNKLMTTSLPFEPSRAPTPAPKDTPAPPHSGPASRDADPVDDREMPPSRADVSSDDEEEEIEIAPFGSFKVRSSQTACEPPRWPRRPRGTGDDPAGLFDLDSQSTSLERLRSLVRSKTKRRQI